MDTNCKSSLFAQRMKIKKLEVQSGPVLKDRVQEKSQDEVKILESIAYTVPEIVYPDIQTISSDPVPLKNTLSSQLAHELTVIHQENLEKISEMTKDQIQTSLQEIESFISPSMIQKLKSRGYSKLKSSSIPAANIIDIDEQEINKMQLESNKTCLHSHTLAHELDKIRYDECGAIVQVHENNKWVGECQGFTLRDLSTTSRSSIPSQRALSITTLSKILTKNYSETLEFLYDTCELDKLIIFSLQDKNINVKANTLKLLQAIFDTNLDKNLIIQHKFGFVYPMLETKENSLLSKNARKKRNLWEEEELKDLDLNGEGDFISSLILKDILGYLVDFDVQEVYRILLCLSLHSLTGCFFIVRHPILDKILLGIPKTYKLIAVLAKSSVSSAYKIKQKLPERVLADLLVDDRAFEVVYSLFSHNQCLEIRTLGYEMCSQGSSDMFMVLSRAVDTIGPEQFTSIFEIAFYKYLKHWKDYIANKKLIHSVCTFLNSFCIKSSSFDPTELIECILGIANTIEINGTLSISSKSDSKYVRSLDEFLDINEWENGMLEGVLMAQSILDLICTLNEKTRVPVGRVFDKVLEITEQSVRILKSIEQDLECSSIPKLVCYRLKPLAHLLNSCLSLQSSPKPGDILVLMLYLSSYDECIISNLLFKLFPIVPEYYLGYLCTEKNVSMSKYYLTKSTKISSWFLGLNENPYLPLPINWAYIPAATETNKLELYLNSIDLCTTYYIPSNLSGIISDINSFFIRKDIDYNSYQPFLQTVKKVSQAPCFAKQANKVKNSVLNMVRDFISTSYLEKNYSAWVLNFLADEIHPNLFKEILEELRPLLSRYKQEISINHFLDPTKYTKFLSYS